MAEAARRWLDAGDTADDGEPHVATQIVFVPAARSPFKPAPIADDAARLAMVGAMAAEMNGTSVWTDEVDRATPGQPSYWVRTLERAHISIVRSCLDAGPRRRLPELAFLIGADQAVALHRWRQARRLLELAAPVIVLRPPIDAAHTLRRILGEARWWSHPEIEHLIARLAPAELSTVNATSIRAALTAADAGPLSGLAPGVAEVIRDRGLYRTRPSSG